MINREAQTRRMLLAASALQDVITLLPFHSQVERWYAMMGIGWIESRFTASIQQGASSELDHLARSPWQFERGTMASRGGVYGVLMHKSTQELVAPMYAVASTGKFDELGNPNISLDQKVSLVHERMAYSLHLGAAMGCMLLWTHPARLPHPRDPDYATRLYKIYREAWNPGRPQGIEVFKEGIHEITPANLRERVQELGLGDDPLAWTDSL